MSDTNKKIDQMLRQQMIRKATWISIAVVVFTVFMSYALYKFYGPDAEIVDYFQDINQS